jgi:hypothetical protein
VSLRNLRLCLIGELASDENMKRFNKAKERYTELSSFETPIAVIDTLNGKSKPKLKDRDKVVRVLIKENKRSPHSLWNSLLIVIFYPMLYTLRVKLSESFNTRKDLDQIVVSFFLEAVNGFSLGKYRSRTFMFVRQMVRRQVFDYLRNEKRENETVISTDLAKLIRAEHKLAVRVATGNDAADLYSQWQHGEPVKKRPLYSREKARLIARLCERVGDQIDVSQLELVISTYIRGERLCDIVESRYAPATPKEMFEVYQCIRKRHSRTLRKIRKILTAENIEQPESTVNEAQHKEDAAAVFASPTAFGGLYPISINDYLRKDTGHGYSTDSYRAS